MTLCWASQALGKTEIINCIIGWAIEAGPGGGMMMVQPNIQMAQGWSKLKLLPMLEQLDKPINSGERTYSQQGANRAETTVSLKIWPEGFLVIGGANSPAALSMFSCRFTFFDEVDRYPPTVATRGIRKVTLSVWQSDEVRLSAIPFRFIRVRRQLKG